jgi:hypothetical protein
MSLTLFIISILIVLTSVVISIEQSRRFYKERAFKFEFDEPQHDIAKLFVAVKKGTPSRIMFERSDGTKVSAIEDEEQE